MARHRRPLGIRDDGLAAVLAPVLECGGVDAALLVDVATGMVLDAWERGAGAGAEHLGAAHADLVRAVLAVPGPAVDVLVLSRSDDLHHVVRLLSDPLGDRLAVALAVSGGRRAVARLRRALGRVPAAALVVEPPRAVPTPEWIPPPRPEPSGTSVSWAAGGAGPVRRSDGPTPPSALPPPALLPQSGLPQSGLPQTVLPSMGRPTPEGR